MGVKAKPIPTAPSTDAISTEKPVRTTRRQDMVARSFILNILGR